MGSAGMQWGAGEPATLEELGALGTLRVGDGHKGVGGRWPAFKAKGEAENSTDAFTSVVGGEGRTRKQHTCVCECRSR